MKDQTRQILIHISAIIGFLSLAFIPFFQGKSNELFNPLAGREFFGYGLLIIIFYFNYCVLVPRLYFSKRYVLYFFAIIFVYLAFRQSGSFIIEQNEFLNRSPHQMVGKSMPPPPPMFESGERPTPPPHEHQPEGDVFIDVNQKIFPFLVVIFFSLILRVSSRWRETEREKMNAELSYLKAQINPHFLFNTLNSIYSLAIMKSDETPTAVVKLSGMMRYVLSEATTDFVSLEKEIVYIKNYIDLQKIRFGESISLDFSINGITNGKQIAPLILISFIENAFKHGINAEEDSVIKIKIDITAEELFLNVFNKKVAVHISEENKSGLGVENTRNRLELLYPKRHKLSIFDTEKDYLVELSIVL
ncbi:MAG: sensor histidine kinase [Emticicia sp.]|uniref:sensor histidine kinase n=1 Tax=Emticicia sp. TaxID=1930953 RepID=UPI003BA60BA3